MHGRVVFGRVVGGEFRMLRAASHAAVVAAGLLVANGAWAKPPAPLVPVALVENVTSTTAEIEFMDYVGAGQVIKLQPRDVLVLSYLKSCAHETITGGTVRIGVERSEVEGGKIVRAKVRCSGGKMQLASAEANASGASSFRLQSADIQPVLYALPPMIQLPKLQADDKRTLIIERIDRPGERIEVAVGEAGGAFYDLAKAHAKPLARGGIYRATIGSSKVTFKVDAKAKVAKAKSGKKADKTKSEKLPVLSRLLRFPPG
jgi:hypothetical protein